jgi:hypothetical protein
MDAHAKLTRLVGAAVLSLALTAGPATAAEDAPTDDAAAEDSAAEEATGDEAPAEGGEAAEGSGKIQMAETPRDRVGLIILAAFGVMAFGAAITATRQIGGKRPQADGEFRWR